MKCSICHQEKDLCRNNGECGLVCQDCIDKLEIKDKEKA